MLVLNEQDFNDLSNAELDEFNQYVADNILVKLPSLTGETKAILAYRGYVLLSEVAHHHNFTPAVNRLIQEKKRGL